MTRVVLYGRPGCHLCDEARALLAGLAAEDDGIQIHEVNIETDDGLLRQYLERIPVIEVEGEVIAELVPDERELRSTLLNTSAR
jgi:glutaredoxin